jgi:crotonobetainyl-CoA:carnitine CoA-transferase CaiB-like acyl-CoA transferase
MPGACAGLRVLDFSQGLAGPMATMVLADFGADVIRVEPVEDDPGWLEPVYLLLQRGKRSIGLDPGTDEGRAELQRLVRGVDVVIESMGSEAADRMGIGYEALAALNPSLVYCSISGFGNTGPFANVEADDGLVMAKAGLFRDQPGWYQDGTRPVYRGAKDASYFAAMLAVQGILAAVRARDLTGRGQRVDTNMLQAITCRQNPQVRWLLREGEQLPEDGAKAKSVPDAVNPLAHHRDPRDVTPIGLMAECKDGRWIMHSLSEPHFFPAWITVLDFDWIWEDERFKGAPHNFDDAATKDELVRLLQARMKERTAAEWMELYVANGNVCADVVQTVQEALRHPQLAAGNWLVEVDDPRVGPILEVGPLANIPTAPGSVRGPAPTPREHTAEVAHEDVPPVTFASPDDRELAGPLDGVTIVEAAYYYATPFATALLAELGARVIKIEPIYGDPYRLLARATGDPVGNVGHNNMVRAMQGKESIALNLKDERGREILHRIVADADVFVHSFRPGVPESLGIDEPTLRKVNPRLVYQYAASYGSVGPYAGQPAIDPVIAAFCGQTAYQSGEGNTPLRESGADPVAAAGHAVAMMLGLFAQQRTGEGQRLESAMIVSNLYLNCEDALSYAGKPPRPVIDHFQYGTGATHRLYQTAPCPPDAIDDPTANPDPRWVFVAAVDDRAFARLCSVAGREDLVTDPRFVDVGARAEHRTELERELEPVFLERSAPDWEATLVDAGVGCVVADARSHFAFLYRDDQADAVGMMVEAEHPTFGGKYWRYAPVIQLSDTPAVVTRFSELGEYSRAILAELGYDEQQMAELHEAKVVSWPAAEPELVGAST